MQQLLHNKKYAVGQSFLLPKNYLIKLATILQNDRPQRNLFNADATCLVR